MVRDNGEAAGTVVSASDVNWPTVPVLSMVRMVLDKQVRGVGARGHLEITVGEVVVPELQSQALACATYTLCTDRSQAGNPKEVL